MRLAACSALGLNTSRAAHEPGAAAYHGGNWSNGANAGLLYLNVNNAPSNDNTNIGARLANDPGQMPSGPRAAGQRPSFGAAVPTDAMAPVEDPQSRAATVARDALQAPICTLDNLHAAYAGARKGKRYTPEALRFARRAESHLRHLRESLINETWQPGEPRRFSVYEPKWRDIVAPPFADRVVHHAIVRVIEPFFERRFIYDSYACRKAKGTHAAVQRTQAFLRRAKRQWGDGCYVVKADVSRYFASINHQVAIDALARTLDDPWLFRLFERILRGYGYEAGTGIPVGALTSQLIANVVLDQLDHHIKDEWGERYYVRFMDDVVLIVRDKADARWRLHDISLALADLQLSLNPKSTYFPYQRGVDFCGYRIWPTHILPRKRTLKRWRHRLNTLAQATASHRGQPHAYAAACADFRSALMSCIAYTKHCDAHCSLRLLLEDCTL